MFDGKGSKSWRTLSLAVALYVGGGQLPFGHVFAADVTGGDVEYHAGDTLPADPIAGGAITNVADTGNVHHNNSNFAH